MLIHCLCLGGSLRGRGWKYRSGFVDGIFPVMSPTAQKILDLVLEDEVDQSRIWEVLDSLPASHDIWDDLINVAVQLRLNKQWDPITLVREKQILFCLNCLFLFFEMLVREQVLNHFKKLNSTDIWVGIVQEHLQARCDVLQFTYRCLWAEINV